MPVYSNPQLIGLLDKGQFIYREDTEDAELKNTILAEYREKLPSPSKVLTVAGVNWPLFYTELGFSSVVVCDINAAQIDDFIKRAGTNISGVKFLEGLDIGQNRVYTTDLNTPSEEILSEVRSSNLVDLSNILDFLVVEDRLPIVITYLENMKLGSLLLLSSESIGFLKSLKNQLERKGYKCQISSTSKHLQVCHFMVVER